MLKINWFLILFFLFLFRDPNAVIEFGHIDRNMVAEFINAAEKILHPAFDVSTELKGGRGSHNREHFAQKTFFIVLIPMNLPCSKNTS